MFEFDNYILLLMSGLTALTVIGRYTANVYDNYFAKVQRFSVKPLSFSELLAKFARRMCNSLCTFIHFWDFSCKKPLP